MCGIFASISHKQQLEYYESIKNDLYIMLNSRGPDSNGSLLIQNTKDIKNKIDIFFLHTRLKINGDDTCQPLEQGNKILIINGEIFNWKELEQELGYKCHSSDCEIIFPLYEKYKDDLKTFFKKLNGQFSFFMYDKQNDYIFVGRDHIGVTPLYMSYSKTGTVLFSSELKCIDKYSEKDAQICVFPPRSYIYTESKKMNELCINEYLNYNEIETVMEVNLNEIQGNIKKLLTESVKSQLEDLITGPVDFGVLLSGGLDSSLIASIVVKLCKELGWNKRVKTFSIGVDSDAPDLVAARKVSKYLDTEHYEYYFSIEQGIENVKTLIYAIESYDCTTIRASTPMYFLAKSIKTDFPELKVILSGELSDELLCYLYGANAPSEEAFQNETVKLVNNVHLFDCLRANKTCMAHSLEVRVPFADKHYVEYIIGLPAKVKMFGKVNGRIEKQILRESFENNYLPNEILWRKKEQFSDGVSGFDKKNNWIDGIKQYTENLYTDREFEEMKNKFDWNAPNTKEKLYYRLVFNKFFKNNSCQTLVEQWVPNWSEIDDPSGRVQNFWETN